jgi:hypothetical protein
MGRPESRLLYPGATEVSEYVQPEERAWNGVKTGALSGATFSTSAS